MLRNALVGRLRWSVYLLLLLVGFLLSSLAIGQTDAGIEGSVTTNSGQPIAGVSVNGSASKTCCPSDNDRATTDEKGFFHLERPGAVAHFFKEGFEPQTLVIPPGTPQVHVTMSAQSNDLTAPPCGAHQPATKQIGWRVRFDVPRRTVKILGGKTDVDYVRYLIKPKTGDAYLELWFGPYALSTEPPDEDFVSSIEFWQRRIVAPGVGVVGTDSWGRLRDQGRWRQTVIAGGGGSRYRATRPEDVALFDQIANSICMVPSENASSTTRSNSQSKP
jgi:hypothetical protein